MDKLRDEVITNVRSCLISTQSKCDLAQIRRDYRQLMGTDIPFVQLGFRNLEQFILSVPTLMMYRDPVDSQMYIKAKVNEKTRHIVSMVSKQKTKRKRPPPRTFVRRTDYYRPPVSHWKPKAITPRREYQTTARPAAVSYNQFVTVTKAPRFQPNQEKTSNLPSTSQPQTHRLSSPLQSAKQRLAEKISNIQLNEPIVSSTMIKSPVKYDQPTWDEDELKIHFQEATATANATALPQLTNDPLIDLHNIAKMYELGTPIVKVTTRKVKKGRLFDCYIQVGENSFSNYPLDSRDEMTAKRIAAKKALDGLMAKCGKRKSLVTSSEDDIKDRILPMVQKYFEGIWSWQIAADYVELYNEELPADWIDVLRSIPRLSVGPIFGNQCVLRYCNEQEMLQIQRTTQTPLLAEVSVPTNSVNFGDDEWLLVEIACVVSVGEIWCRQIDTPEADSYDEMVIRMEKYYNSNQNLRPKTITVGGYYVANYDNSWIRVCVQQINDDQIDCFFIDYGDEKTIPTQDIYQMKREFAKEQAQVLVCRLSGLEELDEISENSEHLRALVGKIVQIQSDANSEDMCPSFTIVPVIVSDPETDEIINDQLVPLICSELLSPCLSSTAAMDVYITHVEADGGVYVQANKMARERLKFWLQDSGSSLDDIADLKPAKFDSTGDSLYLFRTKEEGEWRRVKVCQFHKVEGLAVIQFVDYGDSQIIKVGEDVLYSLEEVSYLLNCLPAQAVRVRMGIVDCIPTNFVDRVKKIMPGHESVLMKVLSVDADKVSVVEFFTRSEARGILSSVNRSFVLEDELLNCKNPSGDGNNNAKPVKLKRHLSANLSEASNKNFPSTGLLKEPPLPKFGDWFDVTVPCAVNPWNFFVQPLTHHGKLTELMAEMQNRYKNVRHSPLQLSDIQCGKIYASKHTDGQWYRTSVIRVIHSGSISVFYCDFGYYATLRLQQLVPLDDDLWELPYQAIKAKLAGVRPLHQNWTVEDCKTFEGLVANNIFVSVIKDIEEDALYSYDKVCKLDLIDTSTDLDVFINKLLVSKGIALLGEA